MCSLPSSKLTSLYFYPNQSERSKLTTQSGSVQPHRKGDSGLHGVRCSEGTHLLLPEKETGINTHRGNVGSVLDFKATVSIV